MKFNKIRGLAAVLVGTLIITSLAGCGKTEKTEGNSSQKGSIPNELSVFCALGGNVASAGGEDFNDCMTFQLLEKETGCHVEWQHPAGGAVEERFNVMVVSGNYPDAIVYNWPKVKGGVQSYIDDGVIVDLTDYIKECMPNFTKFLEENPDLKKDIITDDGKIYYIPYIRADKELCVYQGQVIREDWIKKLNLKMPTNTDELYECLKSFKTQDPNGNGKADEIPMVGSGFASPIGIGCLLWSFGTTYDFHLDEAGEVVYGPLTDEFKEGLKYITKLYSEGLIDMDYLLDNRSKMDAKFTGDYAGFSFGYQPSTYYAPMTENGGKITGIDYIAGPDGGKFSFNTSYIQQVAAASSFAVTTANKNVEGTLKWLDQLYGEKGFMYANFGEEGVSYEMIDGMPTFTEYMTNNENGKTLEQMVGLTCAVRDSAFPMLQSWDYYRQTLKPWGIEAIETWSSNLPDTSRIIPTTLSMTIDEGESYAEIMNQVDTYMQEEVNKIITGRSSIDNWDAVVKQIKKMRIQEAINIKSEAYKRYLSR